MTYSETFPTFAEVDVAVVGAGSAGCVAAVAAARVLLIERNGFPGGTSTAVLDTFYGFYTPGDVAKKAVAGLADDVVAGLRALGPVIERPNTFGAGTGVTYHPEHLKVVWERLAVEAGVRVLLHAALQDAPAASGTPGRVEALVVATRAGLQRVRARVYADASGDADLCHFAGLGYELAGEHEPAQTLTTTFKMVNVDLPRRKEGSKYGGRLYALSQSGAPQALWINVDLWQREGLALPSWDTTWADLLRAAQALTRRDGGAAATQLGMSRPDWVSWIWSAGGDLYSADGARMLVDQPPAVEALTWLQDSVQKHRVAPNAEEQADAGLTGFPNGRLAVNMANRGALGMYRSIDGFAYDAAPLPRGPRGRAAHTAVGHTSIWSGTKTPDAAFSALNFICGVEGQRLYYADGFGHPSRRSVTQETWFREFKTPRAASARINTVFPDTLTRNEARAITPHPREADINQAILRNLTALWNGAKTPREVASMIMAETSPMMLK